MLSNDEAACIYSALILTDDDIAVTAEKINTLLKAAGVQVDSYWPTLFAKALDGNLKPLITSVGAGISGIGGEAVASAATTSSEAPAAKEEPKNEEKKEESEESDDDMGFGLFD